MSKIAAVLSANYRDALWTLDGDTYDGLTWRSPDITQPTEAEIEAQWPAVQQARADAVAAEQAAKQSAISKLAALGLTVDEIMAAFGLGDN